MDLFNYNGTGNQDPFEGMSSDEILKAMEAGLMTGMQYNDQLNNGGGLKVESLDAVLKNLENRLDQLVFWNELNKQKVENTVHQYNQLYKYGQEVGIFNLEGETPTETDSIYRRKSIILKFTGLTGQVTHPAMLVKTVLASGLYTKEVENKTILLQTLLDKKVITADSSKDDIEFDGVFAQHISGINDITGGYRGPGEALYLDMETIVLEEIEENGSHTLRVGDASKDEGRLRPGSWPEQTSLPEGTYLAHIDESGNFHIGVVVSGTAEITRTGSEYTVTFDFTTSNGSKLSGTFSGQIPVRDMGMENIYTSLTEDYVIPSVGGSTASARYYGDRNWGITITWPVSADVVENFYIDLTGDSDDPSEGIPAGTYNVGNYYDRTDFTFMPAYDINDIYAVFNREYTYWLRTSAGEVTGQAPVIGGSIEVSRSGDDYTFTFNVTDDDRNAITGSWTGPVTIENAN